MAFTEHSLEYWYIQKYSLFIKSANIFELISLHEKITNSFKIHISDGN